MRLDLETEFDDVDDLANQMNTMVEKPVEVWCKTREYNGKTYVNAYINGHGEGSDKAEASDFSQEPSFDDNDEIPF